MRLEKSLSVYEADEAVRLELKLYKDVEGVKAIALILTDAYEPVERVPLEYVAEGLHANRRFLDPGDYVVMYRVVDDLGDEDGYEDVAERVRVLEPAIVEAPKFVGYVIEETNTAWVGKLTHETNF